MPLTHFDIRNTKPAEKPFKISDGGGLYILVQPHGAFLWRLKYRYLGKERVLSFGAYPTVSLADAREKREAAKKLLANGKDPASERRLEGLRPRPPRATPSASSPPSTLKISKTTGWPISPSPRTAGFWKTSHVR